MKQVKLNKDGTPRKSGSGRTKGSTSFVNITLAELQDFCGKATPIPISRVWLENMGAAIVEPTQKIIVAQRAPEPEPEQKISFKIHK